MLKLPSIDYLNEKTKDNSISDMINQMTNLILYGVSRFIFNDTKFLLLELKDNIFNCDMLDTISTIINSEQSYDNKFNIIFYFILKSYHNFKFYDQILELLYKILLSES